MSEAARKIVEAWGAEAGYSRSDSDSGSSSSSDSGSSGGGKSLSEVAAAAVSSAHNIAREAYNSIPEKIRDEAAARSGRSDSSSSDRSSIERAYQQAVNNAKAKGETTETWKKRADNDKTEADAIVAMAKARLAGLQKQQNERDIYMNGSMSYLMQEPPRDVSSELKQLQKTIKQLEAERDRAEFEQGAAGAYKDYDDLRRQMNQRLAQNGYDYGRVYTEANVAVQNLEQQKALAEERLKAAKKADYTEYVKVPVAGGYTTQYGVNEAKRDAAIQAADAEYTDLAERLRRAKAFRDYAESYDSRGLGAANYREAGIQKEAELLKSDIARSNPYATLNEGADAPFIKKHEENFRALHPTSEWSPSQTQEYMFRLGKYGAENAADYAARVNTAINAAKEKSGREYVAEKGAAKDSSIFTKLWKDAVGVGMQAAALPSHVLSYLKKMDAVLTTGHYTGDGKLSYAEIADAYTKARAGQINTDYGTLGEDAGFLAGKGLGDVYQLVPSMAQSLLYGNLAGEAFTLASFFVQSADNAFDEAKARGGSDEYAALYSTLCGAAEVIGEKVSLDHLLHGTKISPGYILKQALVEGSEEVATSGLDIFFDKVSAEITNNQTEIQQRIEASMAKGASREEAEKSVWDEIIKDLAWDFTGGALSGGISSTVQATPQLVENKLYDMWRSSIRGKGSNQTAADNSDGPVTSEKLANASNSQLEKWLVKAEKRGDMSTMLFIANEMANREADGTRQRATGDPNSTAALAQKILDNIRSRAGIPVEQQQKEIPVEQGEQRTPLEIDLDEQEAEMRQQQTAQNAAEQQEAPTGQITKPSQQNAAETVKPGDSEQQKRGRSDEEKASAFQRALDGERSRLLAESQERQDYLKRKRAEHSALFDGLKKGDEIYIDGDDIPAMKVIDADGNGNLSIEIYGADGEFVNLERVLANSLTGDNIYNLIETAEKVSVGNPGQVENKLFNIAQNPNGVSTNGTENGAIVSEREQEIQAAQQRVEQLTNELKDLWRHRTPASNISLDRAVNAKIAEIKQAQSDLQALQDSTDSGTIAEKPTAEVAESATSEKNEKKPDSGTRFGMFFHDTHEARTTEVKTENRESRAPWVSSTTKGNEYLQNDFRADISFQGNNKVYHSVSEAMADPTITRNHTLEDVVRAKFQQNRELRQKLFATGNSRIDVGTNLGSILEKVRDELRAPDSVFNDVSPYEGAEDMNFSEFSNLLGERQEAKKESERKLLAKFGYEEDSNGTLGTLPDNSGQRGGMLGNDGQRGPGLSGETGQSQKRDEQRRLYAPKWTQSLGTQESGEEVSGDEKTGDVIFDKNKGSIIYDGTYIFGYGSHRIVKAAFGTVADYVQSVLAKAFGVEKNTVLVSGEIAVAGNLLERVVGGSDGTQIVCSFKQRGSFREMTYGIRNFIHEVTHHAINDRFGGYVDGEIKNFGDYFNRKKAVYDIVRDGFSNTSISASLENVCGFYLSENGYGKNYMTSGAFDEAKKRFGKSNSSFSSADEALFACVSEEILNDVLGGNANLTRAVEAGLITEEEISKLRGHFLQKLVDEGVYTSAMKDAVIDAHKAIDANDFLYANGKPFSKASVKPTEVRSASAQNSTATGSASQVEMEIDNSGDNKRGSLRRSLNTLLRGDAKAIGKLSVDDLNYAINYTLKKADPDLDLKEKRRSYNVIANILSGENLSRNGLRRNLDANIISPQFGRADKIMQKGGGRRNKLYDFISAGKLREVHSDENVSREHADNKGKEFGRYQTIPSNEERITNAERTVLTNALNELDRRGLNIWGHDQKQGESGTTKDFEEKEKEWWEEPEFADTDRYDQTAGDYSDEIDEDTKRYEKNQAKKDLQKMREGDNWAEGAVDVSPEAKEWGRGAKKTAGQKTQGWYDINRRSSLSEREFARQRVMNARAAEDLSFEIQSMEDQAAITREEIEIARRNSPEAKESLKMINTFLEELNDDIDDLHAIDDMFREAVREDPNSDMTKQLATEGTRLVSEIENLRRSIDTLGRLANESIANNNSVELRDAEKLLKKQEQKIEAKRKHLQELLKKSRGGNKSGALVASRAETAFDSMPDDVIKQIIRNDYVSIDMLQDYYGDSDMAFQTMYEFQERVGDTGKTRVPSVHKLTTLERTALHGILADRKKAGKITSGYGGIEARENISLNSEDSEWQRVQKVKEAERAVRKDVEPKVNSSAESEDVRAERIKSKYEDLPNLLYGHLGQAKYGTNDDYFASENVREQNRQAYQESMRTGVELKANEPTPEAMDRLNRMFAERLGIENKDTTAVAIGTPKSFYEAEIDNEKPITVDAAYTNFAAAVQSLDDLQNAIRSDAMKDNPGAEESDIDELINNGFLSSALGSVQAAARNIVEGDDPLNALFELRGKIYEAKNEGEDADLFPFATDSIKEVCDEIGRISKDDTLPYDRKAREYAVAATQLLSAISTRAERLYEANKKVEKIRRILSDVEKKDRSAIGKLATGYMISQMNPTTLFKMLDKFDISANGTGYEIARAIENGTVKSAELIARAARQFDEVKKASNFAEFAAGKTRVNTPLGDQQLTELQAIEFIMLARRLNGMEVRTLDEHGGIKYSTRLKELSGFALKDGDSYTFIEKWQKQPNGKKKPIDFLKAAEKMANELSPAAKAYLKAVNKVMDGLGKEVRQTKTNATGVGFLGMEGKGYYPLSYRGKGPHETDYNSNPDYTGLNVDKRLSGVVRKQGGYAVVRSASETIDNYVKWASNYAGFGDIADMLQTMNVPGNGRGIVNATGDAYGKQFAHAIEKYIQDVNNFTDTEASSTTNTALRAIRQNMAAGALGFSLSVPIKQVASYWDAAGILSMDSLRKAYRLKLFNEKGDGVDNLFLRSRRIGNVDPTVSELLGSGLIDGLKKRSGIAKRLAEATSTMDYRTVDNLFTATVLDVQASLPGIDASSDLFKRAVEAKFNQVVFYTQPIFNKNARSEYQRTSNELVRAAAMFRTQQTQNLNRVATTIMEAKAAKGTSLEKVTKTQLRRTLAGQIAGALEFAALTALSNTVLHGWKRWRDDDDEITFESVVKRFGLDAVESIAGVAWFGDELAKVVADKIFDTNESYGVSMGAISTFADAIKYFGNVVDSLKSDDPLAQFDNMRKFAGAVATLGGKPLNNTYRLANAAVMWGADILKWASKGKYGNRANYDDALKMFDAWIKGGLKEEGAKKQAAKAFHNDQPENLLYNLGILSSLTEEGKEDKGQDWLNERIKGKTKEEKEAYLKNELAEFGRNRSSSERILDYLVHRAVSPEKIDEAVDKLATTGGYNVLYESLRKAGMTPQAAAAELASSPNKSGLSTEIMSEDNLEKLYAGEVKPGNGEANDIPKLEEKNTEEYVNFVSAMRVFENTGNYKELDKLVDKYGKLNENTRAVLDAKDNVLGKYLQYRKAGLSTKDYEAVKEAIKDAQWELDISANTGSVVKLLGLTKTELNDRQIDALIEAEGIELSKTMTELRSILKPYGFKDRDIAMWMYMTDYDNHGNSNGTLSQVEVVKALERTKGLTDPQREEIHQKMKEAFRNESVINHWYDSSYTYERDYFNRKGWVAGRNAS